MRMALATMDFLGELPYWVPLTNGRAGRLHEFRANPARIDASLLCKTVSVATNFGTGVVVLHALQFPLLCL